MTHSPLTLFRAAKGLVNKKPDTLLYSTSAGLGGFFLAGGLSADAFLPLFAAAVGREFSRYLSFYGAEQQAVSSGEPKDAEASAWRWKCASASLVGEGLAVTTCLQCAFPTTSPVLPGLLLAATAVFASRQVGAPHEFLKMYRFMWDGAGGREIKPKPPESPPSSPSGPSSSPLKPV